MAKILAHCMRNVGRRCAIRALKRFGIHGAGVKYLGIHREYAGVMAIGGAGTDGRSGMLSPTGQVDVMPGIDRGSDPEFANTGLRPPPGGIGQDE